MGPIPVVYGAQTGRRAHIFTASGPKADGGSLAPGRTRAGGCLKRKRDGAVKPSTAYTADDLLAVQRALAPFLRGPWPTVLAVLSHAAAFPRRKRHLRHAAALTMVAKIGY